MPDNLALRMRPRTISEVLKANFVVPAIALAIEVFPIPGGP